MSIHISAQPGDIAPVVLMPGDPLRAKYVAEKMLQQVKLVSNVRNIYFYTGMYKGTRVTIGASGMGCPSMGIYSWELYSFYDVRCIVRIGTCGAYSNSRELFDVVNVSKAYSESTYARFACGYEEDHLESQGNAFDKINQTAKILNKQVITGHVHSADPFYRADPAIPKIAVDNNCSVVEMEAFALFANALYFKRSAAALLTITDIIPENKRLTGAEREQSMADMAELALETVPEL